MSIKRIIRYLIAVAFLAFIWAILGSGLIWSSLAVGALIGTLSMIFAHNLIPMPKFGEISYIRLALYPFFLVGQIYLSTIGVIKAIFRGGKAKIIVTETNLQNDFLITLLGSSITLTPGTIFLRRQGKVLSVLKLCTLKEFEQEEHDVKGSLEDKLAKIQKKGV